MSEIYVANRKFKYNGELLDRGDVWNPIGGQYDITLLSRGYVRLVPGKLEEFIEETTIEIMKIVEVENGTKDKIGRDRMKLTKREREIFDAGFSAGICAFQEQIDMVEVEDYIADKYANDSDYLEEFVGVEKKSFVGGLIDVINGGKK